MTVNIKDAEFEKEVLKSEIPVLVDFWAPWCGPCRMVGPVVEEIAKEYDGRMKVCKVNVDEAPQTSADYGIMSIPTLAVIKGGKVVEKQVGALSKSQLASMVSKYI